MYKPQQMRFQTLLLRRRHASASTGYNSPYYESIDNPIQCNFNYNSQDPVSSPARRFVAMHYLTSGAVLCFEQNFAFK